MSQEQPQQALPTTVLGTLRLAHKLYNEVLDTSPLDGHYQSRVSLALTLYLRLHSHIGNEGTFRKGESLREMSDLSLELMTVPYFLGVLCEKKQGTSAGVASSGGADSRQQERGGTGGNGDSISSAATDARVARSNQRLQSLVACNDFLFKFLRIAVEVGLATEKDVETKPFLAGLDRTARLEISKKRFALEDEVKQLESQVAFARQRVRRNARVMKLDEEAWERKRKDEQKLLEKQQERAVSQKNDDDAEADAEAEAEAVAVAAAATEEETVSEEFIESILEDDDEYQSQKRQRHVRFAEWCVVESYALLQGNARELEILGSLSDAEKKRAIEDFQQALQAGGGKPLTSSSAASAAFNRASASTGATPTTTVAEKDANYTVLPGGRVVPFGSAANPAMDARERLREEAFQNRNNPTQTLADFAEGEMAYMKMMQEKEARGKAEAMAEDARLGEDGVEERERQKDAWWADWKDMNPALGPTSKGNYS